MIKTRNSNMTTNSQLSTTEPKKTKLKETKQTTRTGTEPVNGDHMEGYQWRGGGEGMGENVQGIRTINGRYKIDRRRLRIV